MMVPDRQIIMKVKLAAAGYQDFVKLSIKFHVLYQLCEQQLSKQPHYDFGLRNILSVLRTAGSQLRQEKKLAEENKTKGRGESVLLCRTLRDMNMSKFVAEDVGLFLSLINDLFPGLNPEKAEFPEVGAAIKEVLEKDALINHPTWTGKIIQLYETYLVRHGIMVVGAAGCGKSTIISVLRDALTKVTNKHTLVKLNPKAITPKQMYGCMDPAANEWVEGIFTSLWKRSNDPKRKAENRWMVMDGPVDAIWIEDLNTVLDDNKMLTCTNGDRIPMLPSMKALFEPENLNNASPATVSRAGIIYVSDTDLGYRPIIDAWLKKREHVGERECLSKLFDKYVAELLKFVKEGSVRLVMSVPDMNMCTTAMSLLQSLLPVLNERAIMQPTEKIERIFVFAIIWSFGALLEPEDRIKFADFLGQLAGVASPPDNVGVYDAALTADFEWVNWLVPALGVQPGDKYEFSALLVPTTDSIRTEFLVDMHRLQVRPILLVGGPGTSKTSIALQYIRKQSKDELMFKRVNFSSETTPQIFQNIIESSVEKRSARSFGPPANKKLLVFMDDVSMPQINNWGDQVTLEIIRQLTELGYLWNLEKSKAGDMMMIEDLIYILAMNHPGGGKNDIPNRMKRHCANINIPMPSMSSIDQIFGSILKLQFNAKEFSADVLAVSESLVEITIDLYEKTKKKMLPTPAKFHYIFNLRDVSRVFQGMLQTPNDVIKKPTNINLTSNLFLVALWKHECQRVFSDKLISDADKNWMNKCIKGIVSDKFGDGASSAIEEDKQVVNFLRDAPEDPETGEPTGPRPRVYEFASSLQALRERTLRFMKMHDDSVKTGKLELVLFNDALQHMARIARIISMPKGSALLVGVGGSGKQSLTKLATYINGYNRFQCRVSKTYVTSNLLEDIKACFLAAGMANLTNSAKPLTFLFTDAEVKEEGFLEYVNMILSTGEIPGLLAKDEMEVMIGEISPLLEKRFPGMDLSRDDIIRSFYDQVRANLHVVLCFSPVGEKFRERFLKFPALFSGTTIDWFLSWPEQALQSVAEALISDNFHVQVANAEAMRALVCHLGAVHLSVQKTTTAYFGKYRRNVYVTPKSFISFINSYKIVYKGKYEGVNDDASKIGNGLLKLAEAEEDVAKMKINLAEVEKVLVKTSQRIEKMIVNLKEKSGKAEKIKADVMVVKNDLSEVARKIMLDRDDTNRDLEEAKPALIAAENALNAIKPDDIKSLTALKNPPNLIKRIFDGVLILRRDPVDQFKKDPETLSKGGKDICVSSWGISSKVMKQGKFLDELKNFNTDTITEEMCELLSVYTEMDDFNKETAAKASGNVSGLCDWCNAMRTYFFIARFVQPKITALKEAESKLNAANAELKVAEDELAVKDAELKALNDEFAGAMGEKQKTEDAANQTKDKMDAANKLIQGLGGEKIRWTAQSKEFSNVMKKLVGDVSRGCAFLSYCGPFNAPFRQILLDTYKDDQIDRGIPFSDDFAVIDFLTDESTIGGWNLEGLPTDDLSVQNGMMTTMADRWPIMIDPQGQGNSWVRNREAANSICITNSGDKFFRNKLEDAMSMGRPLLIEDLGESIDPVLDPVLNKQVIRTGRFLKINLPDKEGCEYDENFKLYFTTKLQNPHFSPELSAASTIIDFTVTIQGLEDQLLSIVVNREREDLQLQRVQLMKDINAYKSKKAELEAQLLYKLANVVGNLLDDKDIIDVLNNTKKVSQEVSEKLVSAANTQKLIQVTCEEYRPVATRGSIIYFLICDMSMVNVMYQISLMQFLGLFEKAMRDAHKAPTTQARIKNIIDEATYITFFYVCRGIFEKHKLVYILLLSLKVQVKSGDLSSTDFNTFLKGGAALDIKTEKRKPADWIPDMAWLHLCQMAKCVPIFRDLCDLIARNIDSWKNWYDMENPEVCPVPEYEGRLTAFQKLLLVRSLREDRMLVAAKDYIVDVMGKKYLVFKPLDIESTWAESSTKIPLIFLLSPGSNPNAAIEAMAKRKKIRVDAISMGQGQEEKADKLLTGAVMSGSWVLLQNTHLGLGFMNTLEGKLSKMDESISPQFRLWITCEPHPKFPIGLLQISIKMTDEPPAGVKAGLRKSFNWINQDMLEAVSREEWKFLLYSVCFMHTIVQERRNFGPLGFCIPYEFNQSDLEASVMYIRMHMIDVELKKGTISWPAVSYMVCQAQYGGRITDDFDRVLFNTYGDAWLGPKMFDPAFEFAPGYKVLKFGDIGKYRQAVEDLKDDDHPMVFGMHANADLTKRTKLSKEVLETVVDMQPKDGGGSGGGPTREEIVLAQCEMFLSKMPEPFNMVTVKNQMVKLNKSADANAGPKPLNIHLKQEVDRMQVIIKLTKFTCEQLQLAIAGTVIMTADFQEALNCIFDARVPPLWQKKSWMSTTLGLWFGDGLCNRTVELTNWLMNGRPKSYWLTGFFNPQGFLTAVQQEVTRRHQGWALDAVQLSTEVTSMEKEDVEKKEPLEEGIYVWGMFLEAAAWDKKGLKLVDAPPKKLFCPIPCIIVTAVDKKEAAKIMSSQYMCPCYTIPRRTGQYFIFTANIKTEDAAQKWILRGTALMCSKD